MINRKSAIRTACAVFIFGATAVEMPALAADDHRLDDAWKAALEDLEGVMTEKEHALTNAIAYHAAAARLCDGIELDVDEVGKAINTIAGGSDASLGDDQRMERLSNILLTLGTAKGIFLAEGSLQKEQFCKEAMASKADSENDHFWK
jgi:hypothetical protein